MVQLIERRWLREFVLEITPVLEPYFVAQVCKERAIELSYAPGVFHIVIPEAGDSVAVRGLRLDSSGRRPAHAVQRKRGMVLGIDRPVDFREQNVLLAVARDRPEHCDQVGEIVVVSDSGLAGRLCQARGQRADGRGAW